MSKRGIFGSKDDENGDESTPATPPSGEATSSTTAATSPTPAADSKDAKDSKDGKEEVNAAGKPVDAKSPPLGDAAVTDATASAAAAPGATEGERESWGDRPTLEQIEEAASVRVRTADPQLKRTFVAGLEFTPQERTVTVAQLKALGKSHLAAFASDPSIEVTLGESKPAESKPGD